MITKQLFLIIKSSFCGLSRRQIFQRSPPVNDHSIGNTPQKGTKYGKKCYTLIVLSYTPESGILSKTSRFRGSPFVTDYFYAAPAHTAAGFHCSIGGSRTRLAAYRQNGIYAGRALAPSLRECSLLCIYLMKINCFHLPPDPKRLYQQALLKCGGGKCIFSVPLGNCCLHLKIV
jgi:hypothetical protein